MGMGWLGAPFIKKRLRKVQKIEARNIRELCGVGSKGRSPQNGLCFSMQKQHFQRKLHRLRKIFNMGGPQTTASEASKPSACARRSRGSRGLAPGGGCKLASPPCLRKCCILQAKYA